MLKKADSYGPLNSYDALKLIALFAMIVDHLGSYFWEDCQWLRAVGRIAFPLFLFLVGYCGRWKIKPDLIAMAALITLCAGMFHHPIIPLDILVTIALTRCVMRYISACEASNRYLAGIFLAGIAWFPVSLWFDYGTFAFLFAISGYLQKQKPGTTAARLFLYSTLLLHFVIQWVPENHDTVTTALFFLSALVVAYLLRDFDVHEMKIALPRGVSAALRWIARNTLVLYTAHVILFMLIERICFPEKLAHFRWF